MDNPNQFEQKISPAEHLEQIRKEVAASPERAKEIVAAHLEKTPEQIYAQEYHLSPAEIGQLEKNLIDPGQAEKEKVMSRLLSLAEEKGILNAVKIAKNLPAALMDEFHDRLVSYFNLS